MSASVARLRALQRQAGTRCERRTAPHAVGAQTSHAPAGAHMLRQLLRLRDARLTRLNAAPQDRALPGTEIAPGLRLIEARLRAPDVPSRIDGAFDRRDDFVTARVVFFDTETTGLAGGTGTRAFMLGVAEWQGETLRVRQLLITRLAAERAMLVEFARWLGPDTVLVSYNGKSYDAPLLRTRYRLARLPDPTAGLAHVDLLHPTRRRYRGVYDNCRLATIERRVLGILREDDLPGSEAPAAWRTYLRGGPSTTLCRVLAHNRQDVATLARLLRHLSE